MAITKTQSATGNGATVALNGVAAASFVCYVSSYYRASTTGVKEATPTDSNGTFQAASNDAPIVGGGQDCGASIFFVPNANSGTHTVTPQGNTIHNVTITEYAGIATTTPLDQNKSATDGTASHLSQVTGTTGVTAQADELSVIATALLQSNGGNPVGYTDPVTNYTTLQLLQDTTTDIGTQHAFRVLSATGTQSATFNWTTVDGVLCASMGCIATFTAFPVPTTPPLNAQPLRKGSGPSSIGPAGRKLPQEFPDPTAFPVPELFNYVQTRPKEGKGPGRRGPSGRMAPQKYPDTVQQATIINASVGRWTWAGLNSPLSKMINASVGAYTWSGKASPLSKMINASVGGYTWQGKASPLSAMINASVGAYTWQGKNSPLSKMINASVGAWSWSGIHADLSGVVTITSTPGQYIWSGVPAQIQQIVTINAQIGVYSWGGRSAQITTTQTPSKGLAQYGVSFRRKRSQMDEPPDLDVRSALQEALIKRGLIEKVEYSVSSKPVSETEEVVEVKASGISQRDLQAIVIALLVSEL